VNSMLVAIWRLQRLASLEVPHCAPARKPTLTFFRALRAAFRGEEDARSGSEGESKIGKNGDDPLPATTFATASVRMPS
jgi:hypothetical protein